MNPELPGGPTMEQNDGKSSPTLLRVGIALLIFAATIFTVMMSAGVVCYFMPRQYYSKAILEIPDDTDGARVFTNESMDSEQSCALQRSLHIKILVSKGILCPVIDNLKLVDTWSKREGRTIIREQAYTMLIAQMEVVPIRNTDLIQIGVYSTDRIEAVQIATMVATVYVEMRKKDQMQFWQSILAPLKNEANKQRKIVEQDRAKMGEKQEKEGIVDPKPEELDEAARTQSPEYFEAKHTYIKAKKALEGAEVTLSMQQTSLQMQAAPAKIWEEAEPPLFPVKPNVPVVMAEAAVCGTFLGIVFAGIYLRRSARHPKPPVPR